MLDGGRMCTAHFSLANAWLAHILPLPPVSGIPMNPSDDAENGESSLILPDHEVHEQAGYDGS